MGFDFRDPDSFTAGTIGPPGQRVFYLQAADGGTVVSWRLEKQQVRALAEYLRGLLDDLPAPEAVPEAAPLVEPVTPEWIVGNIGVGYDNDTDRIIIVAEELRVDEDDDDGETFDLDRTPTADQARVMLTRAQCQSFIHRTEILMEGGRPPCRLCGGPVDPSHHYCPRDN